MHSGPPIADPKWAKHSERRGILMRNIWRAAAAALAALTITTAAHAADPDSCRSVRFSDVGWTDITSTTAMVSRILSGLGYEPKTQLLAVPVTYESMKNKDIDVF